MKIPKLFAIIYLAGLNACLLHAANPDSEAQAKARAALEQAETAPAAPAVNASPATSSSPAPAAQPPVQLITAASSESLSPEALAKARMQLRMTMTQLDGQLAGGSMTISSASSSPEASARSRELLHQTIAQLDAHPAGSLAMAPSGYVAAPGMVRPVVNNGVLSPEMEAKVRAALRQLTAQLNERLTPEMEAKARTTLHEAIAELDMKDKATAEMATRIKQEKAAAVKETPAVQPAAAVASAPAAAAATAVPAAPAPTAEEAISALSGPKDKRLSDLLALYKADTITPVQYHQVRAKIVAEP